HRERSVPERVRRRLLRRGGEDGGGYRRRAQRGGRDRAEGGRDDARQRQHQRRPPSREREELGHGIAPGYRRGRRVRAQLTPERPVGQEVAWGGASAPRGTSRLPAPAAGYGTGPRGPDATPRRGESRRRASPDDPFLRAGPRPLPLPSPLARRIARARPLRGRGGGGADPLRARQPDVELPLARARHPPAPALPLPGARPPGVRPLPPAAGLRALPS